VSKQSDTALILGPSNLARTSKQKINVASSKNYKQSTGKFSDAELRELFVLDQEQFGTSQEDEEVSDSATAILEKDLNLTYESKQLVDHGITGFSAFESL
jgi:hypothetical protein